MTVTSEAEPPIRPLTISVDKFCQLSGLGRTSTYALIRDKQLRVCKIKRRTLILMESALELIESCIAN